MSLRKHKNDKFNQKHAGMEVNIKKNVSRTAFAKLKALKRNAKPKKVARETVKKKKLEQKEIKRARYLAKKK